MESSSRDPNTSMYNKYDRWISTQGILRLYHSFTLTLNEDLGHRLEPETSRLYQNLAEK